MSDSTNKGYAAAVLAIYLILLVPAVYTTIKHGFRNLSWIGWVYYLVFCSLRIIGSGIELANPASTGAAIISSIGLSPLTIALGGILHEARFYLLSLKSTTPSSSEGRKLETIFVLLFHILVVTAIALLAIGASGLSKPADQTDSVKLARDWHLAGGGCIILLLMIAAAGVVAFWTFFSFASSSPSPQRGGRRNVTAAAQKLVLAVAVAAPVLCIRVIGSAVFYFGKNLDMNPVSGTMGFRVGLYLIPEVIAAIVLLVGGIVSRNVSREAEAH